MSINGPIPFGGSRFHGAVSVPLMFGGRYFVVTAGAPPLVTVFNDLGDGRLRLEVLRNEPDSEVPGVVATKTPVGIVTVRDADGFLYKIRPASVTSVGFGRVPGDGSLEARIGDRDTRVIRTFDDDRPDETVMTVQNGEFGPGVGGIRLYANGNIAVGFALPPALLTVLGLLVPPLAA